MNKQPGERGQQAGPTLRSGVIPGIVARVEMKRDNTIIVTALGKCRFKIRSMAEIYISTSRT